MVEEGLLKKRIKREAFSSDSSIYTLDTIFNIIDDAKKEFPNPDDTKTYHYNTPEEHFQVLCRFIEDYKKAYLKWFGEKMTKYAQLLKCLRCNFTWEEDLTKPATPCPKCGNHGAEVIGKVGF